MFKNYFRAVSFVVCAFSVAGCSMFSEDKLNIEGDRIAFLDGESILQPDFQPGSFKIKLSDLRVFCIGLSKSYKVDMIYRYQPFPVMTAVEYD